MAIRLDLVQCGLLDPLRLCAGLSKDGLCLILKPDDVVHQHICLNTSVLSGHMYIRTRTGFPVKMWFAAILLLPDQASVFLCSADPQEQP
jgi:hypothetical protein